MVLRCWMPDQVRHDRQKLSAFLRRDKRRCGGLALGAENPTYEWGRYIFVIIIGQF
jgi:hypothetical protein